MPTGKSEFGEVFLAKAQGLEEGLPETLVLVKSLQSRDEQQQLDFRREFEMFGKLNHANVVRLLGLCREAEPHYMVLEYVDLVCCWGALAVLGGGSARHGGWRAPMGACCRRCEMFSLLFPQFRPRLSLTLTPFPICWPPVWGLLPVFFQLLPQPSGMEAFQALFPDSGFLCFVIFHSPQGLSALENKHNENLAFLLSLRPVPLEGQCSLSHRPSLSPRWCCPALPLTLQSRAHWV